LILNIACFDLRTRINDFRCNDFIYPYFFVQYPYDYSVVAQCLEEPATVSFFLLVWSLDCTQWPTTLTISNQKSLILVLKSILFLLFPDLNLSATISNLKSLILVLKSILFYYNEWTVKKIKMRDPVEAILTWFCSMGHTETVSISCVLMQIKNCYVPVNLSVWSQN
jgi:hypothetical protein